MKIGFFYSLVRHPLSREAKLEFSKKHRSLVAFVCGVGSLFLLMGFGSLVGELSAVTALVVGSGAFLLAGVVGFACSFHNNRSGLLQLWFLVCLRASSCTFFCFQP